MTMTHDPHAMPNSMAELRRVTQPPEVRLRANAEHWTGTLYMRDLSPYVTWLLLRLRFSANAATVAMILTGWLAAASLLIPGIAGAFAAVLFAQVQMLIDCSDGEVARWRGTRSPLGVFLDKVGHYSTESLIAVALGVRAAGWPFERPEDWFWTTLGFALALVLVLNKALNDMVHVARAHAGLDKLSDSKAETEPTSSLLATLRRAAAFVPFHRIFHSIEMTLIIAVAAVFSLERELLSVMLPLAVLAVAGHFVAIVASKRVRA